MRILLIALIFLSSCNQTQKKKKKEVGDIDFETHVEPMEENLKLQVFTKFPTEIEGCSCYFSRDSIGFANQRYIFVDNFEDVAFVKVNGELVRLTRKRSEDLEDISVKTIYKNENYNISVKVFEGKTSGDEAWLNQGTIRLRSIQTDEVVETEFFGECGC